MNYYNKIREWQREDEERQDNNDKAIGKQLKGMLKPSDDYIIKNLRGKKS